MANRWERGKLGPYTMPQDFTTGGIGINGINNVTPKEEPFLVPAGTLVYFNDEDLIDSTNDNVIQVSGQELSRSTYSELFAVVGTQFGNGDGSTTFDVPDLFYTTARCHGTAAASGIGELQPGTMWDHEHSVTPMSFGGLANNNTFPAPQPITEERDISAPTRGPAIPNATVTFANGPYTNQPHYGPTEAQYRNSRGIRPYRTYNMFSTWTTKPGSLPIGAIVPFVGNDDLTPYANYLLCNGQSVDPATYPLAAAKGITATPDLRGYFISSYRGSEPRTFAQRMGATHRHRYPATPTFGGVPYSPLITTGTFNLAVPGGQGTFNGAYNSSSKESGSASLGPGNETRPVNMAVSFLVRVG